MKFTISLGLALFMLGNVLAAAPWHAPASADSQVAKKPGKTKAAKPLVAAKPSLHKPVTSKVKPVGHKLLETQGESDRQLVEAYRVIRSVRSTLSKGDHDYGGHRGSAVAACAKADHELSLAMQFRGQKKLEGAKKAAPPWHPEPQRYSDMELASKIPVLKRTISLLQEANHDYGGHRGQAVHDLKDAVGELEKALKFAKATGK